MEAGWGVGVDEGKDRGREGPGDAYGSFQVVACGGCHCDQLTQDAHLPACLPACPPSTDLVFLCDLVLFWALCHMGRAGYWYDGKEQGKPSRLPSADFSARSRQLPRWKVVGGRDWAGPIPSSAPKASLGSPDPLWMWVVVGGRGCGMLTATAPVCQSTWPAISHPSIHPPFHPSTHHPLAIPSPSPSPSHPISNKEKEGCPKKNHRAIVYRTDNHGSSIGLTQGSAFSKDNAAAAAAATAVARDTLFPLVSTCHPVVVLSSPIRSPFYFPATLARCPNQLYGHTLAPSGLTILPFLVALTALHNHNQNHEPRPLPRARYHSTARPSAHCVPTQVQPSPSIHSTGSRSTHHQLQLHVQLLSPSWHGGRLCALTTVPSESTYC